METKRRLSPIRIVVAILILVIALYGLVWGYKRVSDEMKIANLTPWIAPYVDVTATPGYAFEQTAEVIQKNIVLAFIVSPMGQDVCTPSWGGFYSLEEAEASLDLDRRIARFRQQGGDVALSFGGLLNNELAINCKDEESLKNAYLEVITRYEIDTVDFDLEGEGLSNHEALTRRAKAIAAIQTSRRLEGKNLAVWLTLPVATFGLTEEGANAVSQMLLNGVDLAGVNTMIMNYGESRKEAETMAQASERALTETHRQLGVLYRQSGLSLSDVTLWAKVGATPMIGQNDIPGEIFTLDDAQKLNTFAVSKGIQRMSLWSANRDIQCGENYVNISVVSDSCSAVKQEKREFEGILGQNFEGSIKNSAAQTTTYEPKTDNIVDNPDDSPYQIWTEEGTYLEGTKVVWHRNVYQAKWWTKGDLPDNPVLQSWETPWQLVGPVLPGEKPVPQFTLAPGTYPQWLGTEIYEAGSRVLLNGVPYQAKWWTQGDSPAASTSNPDGSAWVILSQKQIEER